MRTAKSFCLAIAFLSLVVATITEAQQAAAPRGCSLKSMTQVGVDKSELTRRWSWAETGYNFTNVPQALKDPDPLIYALVKNVSREFRVYPRFYFFADHNKPNAFATSATEGAPGDYPDSMSSYGTVILGNSLVAQELTRDGGQGAIEAVLAHEFAHIMQFQRRFPMEGKLRELHADYLAGWHVGHLKRGEGAKPGDDEPPVAAPPDGIDAAYDEVAWFAAFYRRGDTDFYSKEHHGTKKQRGDAFFAGFECKSNTINGAYAEGERYVKSLGY